MSVGVLIQTAILQANMRFEAFDAVLAGDLARLQAYLLKDASNVHATDQARGL